MCNRCGYFVNAVTNGRCGRCLTLEETWKEVHKQPPKLQPLEIAGDPLNDPDARPVQFSDYETHELLVRISDHLFAIRKMMQGMQLFRDQYGRVCMERDDE